MCTCDWLEQGDNLGKLTKRVHREERGQGENQLRLVIRIFIVTLSGIHRNTCSIFFGKTDFRIAFVWMNLNGEWLGCA